MNTNPAFKEPAKRSRAPLYDEAVRAALIVLWEASDRVCGKRLQPLLPILLDVDNGSEFINDKLIDYCLGHGIELTRSRP